MERAIWITGMPRAGTTWVAQIMASCPEVRLKYCPLFSYRFKNACNAESTAEEWAALFEQVYRTEDEYLDQEFLRRDGQVPSFGQKSAAPRVLAIKSNRYHDLTEGLLHKVDRLQFIALVRNPMATIHSWLSNAQEFPQDEDPLLQWRTGACRKTAYGEYWGFEDWKWVTRLHLRLAKEHPERFLLCHYEAWAADPLAYTEALFKRLSLPFTEQTQHFLRDSQSRNDSRRRSVYKVPPKTPEWTDKLSPQIVDAIRADLAGTDLAEFIDNGQAA